MTRKSTIGCFEVEELLTESMFVFISPFLLLLPFAFVFSLASLLPPPTFPEQTRLGTENLIWVEGLR